MIAAAKQLVDPYGTPFPKRTITPRFGLKEMQARDSRDPLHRQPDLKASYDAARQGTWLSNHWANADSYDADSAHSWDVRKYLRERSRYEAGNNGYYCGALRTYANDLIGTGPKLRMQTGSTAFNRMVEREFHTWAKAIQLNRKLRCLCHAKLQDGEAFAVVRTNPGVNHRIKLDLVLHETEQFSTPYIFEAKGRIDGIDFDEFGNPITYHRLLEHPGAGTTFSATQEAEEIPARFVLHWYRLERPGQHRGVPECASTLNLGAAHRQVREANVTAAKTSATFGALLETPLPPTTSDDVPDVAGSFTEMTFPNGVITALPFGNKAMQLDPKHPGPQYEAFQKLMVNEQMRPLSMPYNKAACDSSGYNFASGRLDHITYGVEQDVEREDCNDIILDRLIELWFAEAVREFGWLGGDPLALSQSALAHSWDWPAKAISDQRAQAIADEKNLASGATTHTLLYSERGYEFTDEINTLIDQLVDVFGVSREDAQSRVLERFFPSKPAPEQPAMHPDLEDRVDDLEAQLEAVH